MFGRSKERIFDNFQSKMIRFSLSGIMSVLCWERAMLLGAKPSQALTLRTANLDLPTAGGKLNSNLH
jgi:hypothetical protein